MNILMLAWVVLPVVGTQGTVTIGPLPARRARRYTLTVTATSGEETITLEREFRSGMY